MILDVRGRIPMFPEGGPPAPRPQLPNSRHRIPAAKGKLGLHSAAIEEDFVLKKPPLSQSGTPKAPMRFISLYHRLPTFIQEAALSAYGAKLRWHRYGGTHQRVLSQLEVNLSRTAAELNASQAASLRALLTTAVEQVPFYRERAGPVPRSSGDALEVLKAWPLLSKADVQQAGKRCVSDDYAPKALLEIHTGGTTGRALAVWTNAESLQRNYAFFERMKRQAGVRQADRVATFAGRVIVAPDQRRPPFWRRNYAANQLLMSSYHLSPDTLDAYIHALEKFGPAMIDSYPSSLESIARRIVQRGGSRVAPKAVITSSETLSAEVRATIEQAFSCRVFDHYGSAEMVAFITQCRSGQYHVNTDYGVLELLDENGCEVGPGEEGEIVATGFINPVMPLIRYRMGDLAVRAAGPCDCGSPFPGLQAITGRMDDVIVTPDGRRIGRIDPIFKAVDTLHEARVVQVALDRIIVEAVLSPGFTAQDQTTLMHELQLRVGDAVRIEFQQVDRVPRTKGGKLRLVESPFGKSPPAA